MGSCSGCSVDWHGELIGPALPISANRNAAAIAGAEKRLDGGLDAELRDELRLVKKFAPKH
jgi:hypothetical protein